MNFAQNELGPDRELSSSELQFVQQLSEDDVAKIDTAILNCISIQWRKFAYIVMATVRELGDSFPDLPDIYFAKRLRGFAENEAYETRGYFENMRYAEIRKVPARDKEN